MCEATPGWLGRGVRRAPRGGENGSVATEFILAVVDVGL